MLKQNVAERLFMEGPGQEKGTAVETAVLIAYAVFCAWGLVWNAAWTERGDFPVVVDRPCFGRV